MQIGAVAKRIGLREQADYVLVQLIDSCGQWRANDGQPEVIPEASLLRVCRPSAKQTKSTR